MKKTDTMLVGIVAGIILLVIAAFAFVLIKPDPAYQSEDSPDGVAFNYLFALQQGDYERAYGYLSPSINRYPRNADVFADDIRDNDYWFGGLNDSSTTLEVDSVDILGGNADVRIHETRFYEGDLFNSGLNTNTFTITLRKEKGNWKIIDADDYWVECWSSDWYGCN